MGYQGLPPGETEVHQFTGVLNVWQAQYNPDDPDSRTAFLTASLARTSVLERATKRKEAEAAGSLPDQQQPEPGAANTTVAFRASDATGGDEEDLTIAQHEMSETDEQGALVILSHWHEQ